MGGFVHPVGIAIGAATCFALSLLIALPDHVSRIELDVTEWINDAPQWVADVLYPVMQLGTLLAPFVVAGVILVLRRDWRLAIMTVVVGVAAWYAAKGVSTESRISMRVSFAQRRIRSIAQPTAMPQTISPATMSAKLPIASLAENTPDRTAATAKR